MEINQPKKIGAGIITISILVILGSFISIIGAIYAYFMKDKVAGLLPADQAAKVSSALSIPNIIITIVLSLLIVVSVSLILSKKAAGIYMYFTCIIIDIIYSIVKSGFSLTIISSLILPILMAVFINMDKEVFFSKKEEQNINM
ncbi:MAG: hypothetical protein Q8900_05510 [Bacillota bacterium]|nr:hypothetical protein [Bacillota bacterium]